MLSEFTTRTIDVWTNMFSNVPALLFYLYLVCTWFWFQDFWSLKLQKNIKCPSCLISVHIFTKSKSSNENKFQLSNRSSLREKNHRVIQMLRNVKRWMLALLKDRTSQFGIWKKWNAWKLKLIYNMNVCRCWIWGRPTFELLSLYE